MTERRAYDIVNDLCEAGYVRKERDGRRNRYEVQGHLPLPEDPERLRPNWRGVANIEWSRVKPAGVGALHHA